MQIHIIQSKLSYFARLCSGLDALPSIYFECNISISYAMTETTLVLGGTGLTSVISVGE